jgi:hypothetical protein
MDSTGQQYARGKKLSTSTTTKGRRGRGRTNAVEEISTARVGRRGERGARRARGRPKLPPSAKLQKSIATKKKQIEEAEQQLKSYTESYMEVEGGEYDDDEEFYEEEVEPIQTIKQTKSKKKKIH